MILEILYKKERIMVISTAALTLLAVAASGFTIIAVSESAYKKPQSKKTKTEPTQSMERKELILQFLDMSEGVKELKNTRNLILNDKYISEEREEKLEAFFERYLPPVLVLLKNPNSDKSKDALAEFNTAAKNFFDSLENTEENIDINANYLKSLIAHDGLGKDLFDS